jgi:hypothetical protein
MALIEVEPFLSSNLVRKRREGKKKCADLHFFISRSLEVSSDVLFHHAEASKNVLLKTEYLSITRKAIDHSFMGKSGGYPAGDRSFRAQTS